MSGARLLVRALRDPASVRDGDWNALIAAARAEQLIGSLSFRLEALPEGPRAKAQADVQEMRAMVTDLLDFMRGQGEGAARRVRIDLSAIVETLADDLADMGQDVAVTHSARAVVCGDAVYWKMKP